MTRGKAGRACGAITVFFSLTLLITLTLITTMLESARLAAGTALAKTMVELGAESVLGAYYLPLYEEYRIFGYWCDTQEKKQQLSEEASWYLERNAGEGGWLDFEPMGMEVLLATDLTKKNGALFEEQVLDYAKYLSVGYAAEELLEIVGMLEETEKVMEVLQKKYEAETKAAQAEETVLRLAGRIDGFAVKEGFFQRNWRGRIKTTECFAKKLIPDYKNQSSVAVSSGELYRAVKGNYEDPLEILRYLQRMKELETQMMTELSGLQERHRQLEQEYEQRKDRQEDVVSVQRLAIEAQRLAEEIADREETLKECIVVETGSYAGLEWMTKETLKALSEAQELLEQVRVEKKAAIDELDGYLKELKLAENQMEPELYAQLLAETQELLDGYYNSSGFGVLPDIEAMQQTLEHNRTCLEEAGQSLEGLHPDNDMDDKWLQCMKSAEKQFGAIQVENLQFSYDGLFRAQEKDGFRALAKELANYGLLALVLEESEKVSQAMITDAARPSDGYTGPKENDFVISLKELLSGDFTSDFLQQAVDTGKVGLEMLADNALYLVYLEEHFACWADFPEEKDAVDAEQLEGLKYQQEYIIAGKNQDSKNLAAVIQRIFFMRFAMNLTGIVSQGELRNQAKAAATAIVGFTGITALVMALQFLIEVIWAAECALTETAALLMGGECSFFVTGENLAVEFQEVLSFRKSSMLAKAEKLSETAGIMTSYKEYLRLFSFLKEASLRNLRTMDIVQQTIQIKYDKNFQLADCIGRYWIKAEVQIPYRFLLYTPEKGRGKGVRRSFYYEAAY